MPGGRFKRAGLLVIALLGSSALALEGYTRLPDTVVVPDLTLPPGTRELTLVFHGSGGSDEPLMQRIAAAHAAATGAPGFAVDWSSASDNRLRAAANARVVGAAVGRAVAESASLRTLRLIGHSSGAYVLDAVCESARAAAAQPLVVRSVYLDPFGIAGFADWTHGSRQHGRCADFALAVINTDDAAPATNRPLQQAYNVDVTGDPRRPPPGETNLHYWPVTFYADAVASGALSDDAAWSHQQLPRGRVVSSVSELRMK
ncbi:MAG: hypothetical protein V2J12_04750 [Gammaproteobacteria bacterium]|jgi:hypothetical protein|nr:hypothetical protein [Gammaproteobacteria bacterium]